MPFDETLLQDRIWQNCIPVPFSGCWIWLGSVGAGRYGRIMVRGKRKQAHRVAYEAFKGLIPKGLCACHRCDVSLCVNPDHLFLGTQADNVRDCLAKGRHRNHAPASVWSNVFCAGLHRKKPWRTRIKKNGHTYYRGYFATREEARAAVVPLRIQVEALT